MKKVITLASFTMLIWASCTKEEQIQENQTLNKNEDLKITSKMADISFKQLESLSIKFNEFKAANEASQQKNLSAACRQTVHVPDDYSTIQDAIDAVCENGNVFVRSGIYLESPGISKKGLFIKAIGDVTLKGGFGLGADNVKIHGFKIDNSYSEWSRVGIASASGFNGFDIKQNTIYSSGSNNSGYPFGHIGIYFEYCDNVTIVENKISGDMEVGIYIDAVRVEWVGWDIGYGPGVHPFGSSINNTILNNTITGIFGNLQVFYPGSGIQLRGNIDNTIVQGNNVNTTNGWGISLWSFQSLDRNCDNNIVKNNTVKNTLYNGIEIFDGGSKNTIGPNNESSYNGFGIYLYDLSSNNRVFNNTAKNNSQCDIVNLGTSNTFKNNTAGCTFGVN